MKTPEELFETIVEEFSTTNQEVLPGKMMSSPALQYKGKVFAFFWKEQMTFKLGKERDLEAEFGIAEYDFLSPFKNKPPMKGWYVVSSQYADQWPTLTQEALFLMEKTGK